MNVSVQGGESRSDEGRNNWIARRSMRTAVLDWWTRACAEHGTLPGSCRTASARRLVDAVIFEAGRGPHRTGEDRVVKAVRAWVAEVRGGDDIPGTFRAVTALREVLTDSRSLLAFGWPATRVHRIFDVVMAEVATVISGNLHAAAFTDPLTGCGNRRGLNEDLPNLVATATRAGKDLTVVVIDLDGLKKVNDTHGHGAGDAALRALADACQECLRETDRLYRIGGDEFVAVLPFTDHEGASEVMGRVATAGAPAFSWGVASMSMMDNLLGFPTSQGVVDPGQLITAADAELYAKRRASRSVASERSFTPAAEAPPVGGGDLFAAAAAAELSSLTRPATESRSVPRSGPAASPSGVSAAAAAAAAAAELSSLARPVPVTPERSFTPAAELDMSAFRAVTPRRTSGAIPSIFSLDDIPSADGHEVDGAFDEGDEGDEVDGRVVGRRLLAGVVGLAAAMAAFFALTGVLSSGGPGANQTHQASTASNPIPGLTPYRLESTAGSGTNGTGSGSRGTGTTSGGGFLGGIGTSTGGGGQSSSGGSSGYPGSSGGGWGSGTTGGGSGTSGSGSTGGVNKTSGGSGGGSGSIPGSGGSGGGSNSGSNGGGGGGSGSTLTGFLNGLLGNPTEVLTNPTATINQAVGAITGTITQATGNLPVPVVTTVPQLPAPVPTLPPVTTPPVTWPAPPVTTPPVTWPAPPVALPVAPPASPVTWPAPPASPVTVPPVSVPTTLPPVGLPGL